MRKLPSFIDGFSEYTEGLPSPSLFRKWAGIAIVAGALERKVWLTTRMGNLYPNLYTIFVAPPGVGKTVLTSRIWSMWQGLKSHHVASSSVTKASLIDELNEARRDLVRPEGVDSFNSLLVASNELGVLIPGYENDFMNTLTDLYDGHPFGERRRTREINIKMEKPQLNFVAATTPSYLNNVMPEGAWDQGFISRVLLIYSGETTLRPLFEENNVNQKLYKDLEHDLDIIGKLYGPCVFDDAPAKLITDWHMAGGPPAPDHPRLLHYNIRRTAHLLKLCVIASVSRSDELRVTEADFVTAFDWLVEVETFMPDIFKAMKSGGDSKAIESTWHFCYEHWMKKKEPIPETIVVGFLQERIPAHSVMRVLDIMVKSGLLTKQITSKGQPAYKPMAKQVHG